MLWVVSQLVTHDIVVKSQPDQTFPLQRIQENGEEREDDVDEDGADANGTHGPQRKNRESPSSSTHQLATEAGEILVS